MLTLLRVSKKKKSDELVEDDQRQEQGTKLNPAAVAAPTKTPQTDSSEAAENMTENKTPSQQRPRDDKAVSIKNLLSGTSSKDSVTQNNTPAANTTVLHNKFTFEQLIEAWNIFAEKISDESPRISKALAGSQPELREDNSILLRLDNSSLKDLFDPGFKYRLEHHLRETLQNSLLTINSVVELTERTDILYTDEQKFNHLASKNPAVKDFKRSFNLDFE